MAEHEFNGLVFSIYVVYQYLIINTKIALMDYCELCLEFIFYFLKTNSRYINGINI